jgi:hypothetical protein
MIQPIFKHMELQCKCGRTCIRTAKEILANVTETYIPCQNCPTVNLKKFKPLNEQIELKTINHNFGRCECGKRHLDLTIAHILKIMVEEGQQKENANLRNACVPLITPAYSLQATPYLGEKSLIVISPKINAKCAERILEEVPEVKGVLKGGVQTTVGIKDSSCSSNVYELLAGCDMRCDIVNSPFGPIFIHKNQSEIHIEFPRPQSPKITALYNFLNKNYVNPVNSENSSENNSKVIVKGSEENSEANSSFTVLDATCGPGTLGIFSLMAGARKVVFNDLWKPATTMTAINLESNGFKVDFFDEKLEKCMIARGDKFEVYNLDIRDLTDFLDEKFDLCIIDPFPGVDSKEFIQATEKLAKNVLIIE